MKKKIIQAAIIVSLLSTQFYAFAAFTDLNTERLNWAKQPIEEMTKMKIIKGYEDNTFRPDNAVSKEESLVLMSRITGFRETSSEQYVEIAKSTYENALKDYSTQYKDEISYLLYKGVLTEDDLPLYIENSIATKPLKRYESAILLTKLLGEEETAKKNGSTSLTFDDVSDIPSIARPYVAYVAQNGIMQGMGENKFEPNYDVSRAQIATLLYRVLSNFNYTYLEGSLSLYTESSDTVKIITSGDESKSYTIRNSIPAVYDGAFSALTNFAVGSSIRITFSGDKIVFVEGLSPEFEETAECIYVGFENLSDGTVITVKDPKTGETKKYTLAANPTIIRNDKSVTVKDLVANDYLKIDISKNKAVYIEAENDTKEITGTISSIVLEPKYELIIQASGNEYTYDVYDSISVKRNGKSATLADIMAGDKVTVTLEYDVISNIVATSSTSKKQGALQEIRISTTPSIIVKGDNNTLTTYSVLRTVEITRNGTSADIYSLRVGDSVTVTVEGSTVTKIDLTASAASSSVTGTVEYANSSAGYIKLYDTSYIIFTNKAKVQDNAGKSLTLKNIKEGVNITVFGTQIPGSVEATLIIVN